MNSQDRLSEECEACRGTGGTPFEAGDDCPVCGGDGLIWKKGAFDEETDEPC